MIGIFDSGMGGLTVVRALRALAPTVDIVYFGDTANAPYGTHTPAKLRQFCQSAVNILSLHGARHMMIACNSASTVSYRGSSPFGEVTVMNIVESASAALTHTPGDVLVVATSATVNSGVYQAALARSDRKTTAVALPRLASLIERGAKEADIDAEISAHLTNLNLDAFSRVVLGCTHYPLVKERFVKIMGDMVSVFDPAHAFASRTLQALPALACGTGRTHIILSAPSAVFENYVRHTLFPDGDVSLEVIA